ncbi:LOW QUALITY PROTEIN: tetratricopeptide repeat protein 13 [Danio aesculapii]|uniref:LOW QUALITY PROTEIN: tetratricopeptide repeat protein 13 n=1 Tax=Danio aesculapii TaxID=1142201 RepID=UPI0024BF5A52|nr:LOW QUALITY PROTEIN: tetratricopeptide repeat protein 13 [Danio aesculapii]
MAPAGGGVVLAALSLLYLCGAILSSEYFSTLTFFNSELHKHGCSSPAEWEEYAADCESSILQLEDPDCEEGSSPPCESVFSLNAEKILNQAKLFVEQRRFPFAVDNQNTNEELAIGYVLIGNGLYDEAIKHFSLLLQGDPELVSAIYGRGIAYGKKSLQDIKNADLALYELSRVIALEPNRPEVYEQRAEILSPLGRISEALSDLTKAIQLQPSARLYRHRGTLLFISEDYMAAMEDFQQSLELKKNQPIAMLYKGLTFFHRGLLKEAIEVFKEALKLKSDFIDAYKSLGQAYRELGDIENAMESFQKALLLDQNHIQSLQLRGMMLYHHGSLQEAIGNFKDVLPQNFDSYSAEVQKLICTADHLGALMQYDTSGFLPNLRIHRAMGLATIEVMQAMQRTWSNSKVRVNGKTRQLQWRDMFDIAVKWRRIADPDQPVLWLDQMPARSLSRGFNNHINLIRGQIINIRYLEYFSSILSFVKDRILVYHGAYNPRGLQEVKQALENVNKVEDLLPIMKQFNSKTRDGFTVNSKVPSLKDPGKEYDGFTITITGDRVGNMLFSVETQTTDERTQQYQSEIEALYKDLTAKGKALMLSTELGDADAVCNLILSLVYYFCNLMPLSRGSSVVAYSVVMGALMASGKEVLGRIPSGKLFDFEAMTTASPDRFSKTVKSWMNLKSLPSWYQNLPSVSETFQLTRTMIEVLNTDSSSHCPKKS